MMRNGKVIDIRSGIADHLHIVNGTSAKKVVLVDTDVVREMRQTLTESDATGTPPATPRKVATVQVRTQSGSGRLILKLRFTDTVADIRRYIDAQRPPGAGSYVLRTAYPRMILSDDSATVSSCSLAPNGTVFMSSK